MQNSDFKSAVSDIPAGLIACTLGGKQLHIVRISENALWLRQAEPSKAEGTLEVCFRQQNGAWNIVQIDQYQSGEARSDDCGALIRLSFFHGEYIRLFRKAMAFYADYLRAFEDGAFPFVLSDADDDAPSMPEFDLSWLILPDDREICISLHDPLLQSLYLENELPQFMEIYARMHRIPPVSAVHRLYVGNTYCRQLMPDADILQNIVRKAGRENLALTLVTPPDPRLPDGLLQGWQGEIVVNDWGLIHRLQHYPQAKILLGTLLNKRRKDPRMHQKPDLSPEILRRNSLNSPEYMQYLRKLGVQRWEFERCGYDYDLPESKCSLHLPWYQTNTSVWCTLRALCEHGDRGRQGRDEGCPKYCQSRSVLYPRYTKIVGRGNSLLAMDDRETIECTGFDRIVLNL